MRDVILNGDILVLSAEAVPTFVFVGVCGVFLCVFIFVLFYGNGFLEKLWIPALLRVWGRRNCTSEAILGFLQGVVLGEAVPDSSALVQLRMMLTLTQVLSAVPTSGCTSGASVVTPEDSQPERCAWEQREYFILETGGLPRVGTNRPRVGVAERETRARLG